MSLMNGVAWVGSEPAHLGIDNSLIKCFNKLATKNLVVKSIHSPLLLFSESFGTKASLALVLLPMTVELKELFLLK